MSGYRLQSGGLVDRSRPLRFTFDGRPMTGFRGDTLASALLANGVNLVGRSFKYHRPRGVLCAGCEEPNALVTLGEGARREPNIPATTVELRDGLVAASQNRWPSLAFDMQVVSGFASPVLSAGFYYKTFMGPTRRAWMWFEPFIRKAAGLGAAPDQPDPDVYDKRNHFTDVLVVGGGPAGLNAALAAARTGVRVTLAEQSWELGGAVLGSGIPVHGARATDWISEATTELENLGVRILRRTSVFGYYDGDTLGAVETEADHPLTGSAHLPRQRFWTIRARHTVLATGAIERPIVFPGNDRPGVMLADAVRVYAARYGVATGRSIVVFTNNDSAYQALRDLATTGVQPRAVIDVRSVVPDRCRETADAAGAELICGMVVCGTMGRAGLRHIDLCEPGGQSARRRLEADCLAVSGGWTPVVHLASQMGSAPVYDPDIRSFVPGEAQANWSAAGAVTGALSTAGSLRQGTRAGAVAAANAGAGATVPKPDLSEHADGEPEELSGHHPQMVAATSGRQKAFVDFQNDVTAGDVELAYREGYRSVEHLKRYTTLGMATDQGKTANVNAIALVADLSGRAPEDVGSTRFRPPFTPVSLGALAGRHVGHHFAPERRTPMHEWHLANGAVMVPVGPWLRPRAYLRAGETIRDAYIREASAVRASVGMCDVSTLGKIDVQGPDAAEFLNRVYSNPFLKLPVGKARYGLMLRDDGMLLDDGTTWRLGETSYLMTTTTGAAGTVMQHLERLLSIAWPDLKVAVTSTTSQWAGMSLAGPRSRDVLAAVVGNADVSDVALPFMGLLQTTVDGVPVIVARLSFSGERAYEIFCGAGYGLAMWKRVLDAGSPFDIQLYGTEALGTLRIEKGHIAGGELDGRISPHHVGLSKMLSDRKQFFGSALAHRDGLLREDRYEMVGLISLEGRPLRAGAHVVTGDASSPGPSQGFVSSVTYSPALEKEIALALVKGGSRRIGETLHAADPVHASHQGVEVVSAHFYDPDGERMRN